MNRWVSARRRWLRGLAILATSCGLATAPLTPAGAAAPPADTDACRLANGIRHVIYLQFDNVHFTRDNPNVPSDLEQMPHLLSFIERNGVLLTNEHTPLISHTSNGILTSLTGLYGSNGSMPIGNSYGYYRPDGTVGFASSFQYWTASVSSTDPHYNLLTPSATNTPAPWVPFTRAGCNVGVVALANMALENVTSDVVRVFGADSEQAAEAKSNRAQAVADFEGIAVHCAKGVALCSPAHGGVADVLPDEPGGYNGFNALFGAKYVDPLISSGGPLEDLNGNVIADPNGHVGFPGFDSMVPAVTLAWVAAMQEHGVPVTFAYISDAHDKHPSGPAYGPGEAGYVAQLKAYDDAFDKFFRRLAADGINPSNTLFVITTEEGDHFVGGAPSPARCDGVHVPCTYAQIGELDVNVTGLLATQAGLTTPFDVHFDMAPNFYLRGNPAPDSPTVRAFERAVARLTVVNPLAGRTERLVQYLADPVEMGLLHMVNADPARTPTFTMFANPDYWVQTGPASCNAPCVVENPQYAWNHGGVAPEINTIWLGLVGPGVRHLGRTNSVWADETDTRPTILTLVGLKDDYAHDGRVLFDLLDERVLPVTLRGHREALTDLAQVYKQLNAAVGEFGLATLRISTRALESDAPDDAVYTRLKDQLQSLGRRRDALASRMIAILEAAAFRGQAVDQREAASLASQGRQLQAQAKALAAASR